MLAVGVRRYGRSMASILVRLVNPLVVRLGPVTTVTVTTRTTGKLRRLPATILETGGRRYLVSVRGDAAWIDHLRSAGSCELRHRGWVQRCAIVEVPPADRAVLVAKLRRRRPDPALPIFELRARPPGAPRS